MIWNPTLRLVEIANRCVQEGSARSLDQALCRLYDTSLVSSWWDEILCGISSWMGRTRVFLVSSIAPCPALLSSAEDLIVLLGLCRDDVFEIQINDDGYLVIRYESSMIWVRRCDPHSS